MLRRITLLLAAIAAGGLAWRLASGRRRLPCPRLFWWSLDNPVRDLLWPPRSLVERAAVRPGQRLLEVGPGIGYYTVPLAQAASPGGRVVCLDLQASMLAALSQRISEAAAANVDLVRGDATRLPFRPHVFDRSVLVTVLGEVPERAQALAEQRRVLRPDGVLAVGEQFPDPHYVRRRTAAALAEEAGLRVTAATAWTPGHLTLLSPAD